MTTETELPSGYKCSRCEGTGLSSNTAEPISAVPSFVPKPMPCSDCARRASGTKPYERGTEGNPYTIWHAGRWH